MKLLFSGVVFVFSTMLFASELDDVQKEYASYFLNDKLAQRFTNELNSLPDELQYSMLETFALSSEQLPEDLSARNKHRFALMLLKAYQEVVEKQGSATGRVNSILDNHPELNSIFAKDLVPLAKAADYREKNAIS
ncbi:hypothetical protein ACPUVO_05475 [Pseudocolwellia sp. HL-MZ19]|uniref:hypothetical protein n=1 Tax=Pseudocolwellia sp. HL-MZ19 TaxID=3400846 RepID=UPI003CE758FC